MREVPALAGIGTHGTANITANICSDYDDRRSGEKSALSDSPTGQQPPQSEVNMLGHSDYDAGVQLHILIESAIDNYEQDRQQFWNNEGEAEYLSTIDGIAGRVLEASEQLVAPSVGDGSLPLTWDQSRILADVPGVSDHVLEKVQIAMAWEFANRTDAMARRCLALTTDVLQQAPGDAVIRFLRRLTRCYIAGFLSETIILCRAVLETALIDKYRRANKPLPHVPAGKSEMAARLEKAEDLGWLSRRARTNARTVWLRGNKAVHEDPVATTAALETIQLTMSVLAELYDAAS